MTDQGIAAAETLKAGSILGRSYTILLGKLSTFFIIALATSAPSYLFYIWMRYDPVVRVLVVGHDSATSVAVFTVAATIVEVILSFVASGFVVYGTLRELQQQPLRFGEMIRHSLPVLVPVVLVSVAVTLVSVLGALLLVVPGLVLMVMYWVAVPVAVVERRSVGACMERSSALTKGSRWPIFALLVISTATNSGYGYAVGTLLDYETAFLGSVAAEWLCGSLLVAYWSVVSAVTYFDLRRIKEGAGVEDIAAVFD